MEYKVAVQSMMSTYRKVNRASTKWVPLLPDRFHC
jgi:hypothetical protein